MPLVDSQAFYSDGTTAARQGAALRTGASAIEIELSDAPVIQWRYEDVAVIAASPMLVLASRGSFARLTVADPEAAAAIRASLSETPKQRQRARQRVMLVGILVVLLGLAAYVAANGRAAVGVVVSLVPPEWEAPLGDSVMREVIRYFADDDVPPLCTGQAGQRALDLIVARLNAPGVPELAPVRVVNSEIVNAATAPGGRIVLFRGLIEQARSPEEIAGVLAHEIGHARHRHPMQMLLLGLGVGLAVQMVTADVTGGVVFGAAAQLMMVSSYGRAAEREADEDAKRLLDQGKIASRPLANFFERMAVESGDLERTAVFRLISSHPDSGARAQLFRDQDAETEPLLSRTEWQALKTICEH